MRFPFETDTIKGFITYQSRDEITIEGNINETVKGGKISFQAANPCDRRSSFSGSGLPFANYQQAFEKSPNVGDTELGLTNMFKIQILLPNSYYISLGTVLVCPTIFIEFNNGQKKKIVPIELNRSVPYRTLTYPISQHHASRNSPSFYEGMYKLPVRTQDQILKDSAYHSGSGPIHQKIPDNYWGLKPPV